MQSSKKGAAQALFKSIRDDGSCWLFVILSDGWAITRDGEEVAAGAGNCASIKSGIREFVSLMTAAAARDDMQCHNTDLAGSA
jgi:hypothetical protein